MNGKHHYLLGEATLVEAQHAGDHVLSYRLAATAQAHFAAAIYCALSGGDREENRNPPPPEPVSVGLPIPKENN